MREFKTSLVREKFVIHDPKNKDGAVTALSNRIRVSLKNASGQTVEVFIVRAHNMHLCVRMAGRVLQSYRQAGPLMSRTNPFDWESAWASLVNNYERKYNPDRWVAIYHEGKALFSDGDHHALLDLIEKCDAENMADYEMAIPLAEDIFKQTGKVVKIDYDANVALAIHYEKDQGRSGIILRGADRTTTFTFTAAAKDKNEFNQAQCLAVAAAFLEGIQMAFMVGMNQEKIQIGKIAPNSEEEKKTKEAKIRLGRLSAEIANLEGSHIVRYRPERPEFHHIVMEAEQVARELFSGKSS